MNPSPVVAAGDALWALDAAGDTAFRARRCRARDAAGGRAAVAEASRRPAQRSLVQWRKMRGRAPQPHPSVVDSVPSRELVTVPLLRNAFEPFHRALMRNTH